MATTAIDCTPTWRSLVPIFCTLASDSTDKGALEVINEIAKIGTLDEAQRIVMGLRQSLLPQDQFKNALIKLAIAADRRNRDDYERDNDTGS